MFLLVIGALRSLAEQAHPPGLVLDAFLLRAMSVAGWEPALSDCARCAEPGPHRHFSVPGGGMVCPACRPTGSAMPSPVTVELLDALLTGDWATAEASQGINRREGSGLVAALLQWHLERGLRSLSWWTGREAGRPPAEPAPLRCPAPGDPARQGAPPRRRRHGRQRPVGQGARPAPHQGPRGGGVLAVRLRRGRHRAGGALSAYAFSTENWKRSPEEVRFLMGFNRDVIRRRRDEMHELGCGSAGPGAGRSCGGR